MHLEFENAREALAILFGEEVERCFNRDEPFWGFFARQLVLDPAFRLGSDAGVQLERAPRDVDAPP